MDIGFLDIKPTIRAIIDKYTSAAIIGVASFVFMNTVSFLPGAPFFVILISAILVFIAIFRSIRLSSVILSLIVIFSIFYQLTGFMVWTTRSQIGVIMLIFVISALLVNMLAASQEPTSMAIAVLAIAVMFTPYYYLSVALIVAAAAIGRLSSIGPVSVTYVITMIPLLLIENGLAFGGSIANLGGPILFSQLGNFEINMRPPLVGFNIFLGAFSPNFFDAKVSAPVVAYLSGNLFILLLVPLAILALVFSASAIVAGVLNDMLSRLSVFVSTSQQLSMISPLVASLVTPLTFAFLITSLSAHQVGGYQTTLQSADTVSLVVSSLVLGIVFTAREYGIQWSEKAEKIRIILKDKIESLQPVIKSNEELLNEARTKASSIYLNQESRAIAESVSVIEDMKRGLGTADYSTLNQWMEDLDHNIFLKMNGLSDVIRLKIIGQLNLLISSIIMYNENLKEVGLTNAFPDLRETKGDIDLRYALIEYSNLVDEIKTSVKDLFESYQSTYNAYNIIMSQLEASPPLDPMNLFESDDYEGGIKLIAEEYWLNFHIRNLPELEHRLRILIESITRFQEIVDEQTSLKIEKIKVSLQNSRPVNSLSILEDIKTLKAIVDEILTKTDSDVGQIDRIVKSLIGGASKLIKFEGGKGNAKLNELRQTNREAKPTLSDTSKLFDELTILLKIHNENKKTDENNLIIISQYPIAKKIIDIELEKRRAIDLTHLPFQRQAALTYLSLYAYNNPDVKYNEENGVITRRNA